MNDLDTSVCTEYGYLNHYLNDLDTSVASEYGLRTIGI